MRIDHYLKDADQWGSHNLVWCRFVCAICVVEIGVDESIAVENLNLISTLMHRALMICTKSRLNKEIERIKKILLDNGYPKNIINTQITKKIAQFSTLKRFGPEKCPVYLRVPWISKPSTNLKKEVKTAVESCYGSVSTRLVFTSKRMVPVARQDVLPAI